MGKRERNLRNRSTGNIRRTDDDAAYYADYEFIYEDKRTSGGMGICSPPRSRSKQRRPGMVRKCCPCPPLFDLLTPGQRGRRSGRGGVCVDAGDCSSSCPLDCLSTPGKDHHLCQAERGFLEGLMGSLLWSRWWKTQRAMGMECNIRDFIQNMLDCVENGAPLRSDYQQGGLLSCEGDGIGPIDVLTAPCAAAVAVTTSPCTDGWGITKHRGLCGPCWTLLCYVLRLLIYVAIFLFIITLVYAAVTCLLKLGMWDTGESYGSWRSYLPNVLYKDEL